MEPDPFPLSAARDAPVEDAAAFLGQQFLVQVSDLLFRIAEFDREGDDLHAIPVGIVQRPHVWLVVCRQPYLPHGDKLEMVLELVARLHRVLSGHALDLRRGERLAFFGLDGE